jgi:dienelactone hydrolase
MGNYTTASRRCDLNVQILEEADCGKYLRRLISYQSEPGSTTPAYLLIPKTALSGTSSSLRGILSLHSTSLELGHKVVVGLGDLPNRDNAHELALRGHVVIAPAYPLMADYNPDLQKLGYQSGTMKAIWDNTRALDLLDSLPFVHHGKYGVIGHSLGGHNALFTAAFDARITAVVCSCGFDSFGDYKDGDLSGWTQARYMPKIASYKSAAQIPFDFDDVLVAIAPRPVFVSAPVHDDNFKWQSVDRIVDSARQKAHELQTTAAIELEHPACDHDFPPDVRLRAYEFLEGALR